MSSVQDEASSYDAVPYESKPLRPTHPDHLAVQTALAGFDAPDTERCRVLEIGCATGGNLLPMALSLPQAHFVGVDISPAQIAAGRRVQQELGIGNLELVAGSITDVQFARGSFDYVVCHGVFSWVPEVVRQGILATCARVLSPAGVAYVSYNTYPGWHLRSMVRDMLLYRTRGIVEPQARIARSREFLAFLHANARDRDTAFVKVLGEEAQLLAKATDTYVFHEHLEANNRPLYFHEFVAAARAHGLHYVTEAVPDDGWEGAPGIVAALDGIAADPIERGQYLDFLQNRTFRRSLLRRTGPPGATALAHDPIERLWLGSPLHPERADPDCRGEAVEAFAGPGGLRLSIGHPWLKTAFVALGQRWPEFVPFAELAAAIERQRGAAPAADELREILGALRQCHAGGVLKLSVRQGAARRLPGSRPLASPLARWMARTSNRVSSLCHELVELREVDRLVLLLLDGSRDRGALGVALRRAAEAASLPLPHGADAAVAESLGVLGMASMLLPTASP